MTRMPLMSADVLPAQVYIYMKTQKFLYVYYLYICMYIFMYIYCISAARLHMSTDALLGEVYAEDINECVCVCVSVRVCFWL